MAYFYRKKFHLGFVFLLLLTLSPSSLWARTPSASANIFLPATDPSAYLTVYGSQTLQPWRYHFGAYFNYARDPLEVGLGGVKRTGIVNRLLVGDFFGSLGITDWWQIGLNAPVAVYEEFNNISTGKIEKTVKMGDVRVETKLRVLDIDRYSVGISVLPYLLTPTGSGSHLVGNNGFAGGGKIIVDVDIKNRVQASLNVGGLIRQAVTVLNTKQSSALTYGVGVKIRTWEWMDILGEAYGNSNFNNLFKNKAEAPFEMDGGLQFFLPKPEGLAVTLGGGAGLTFGYGSPSYRLLAGLTYPNPKRIDLPAPPPPPVEEVPVKREKDKISISKKIHFEFNRAVIRPVSYEILDAVVAILKENPDITKIRIEGHTDSRGTDEYNLKLSQKRAEAVRSYLVSHGIEKGRLTAKGYGESRPITTNDTDEGRARNRRVEFVILEQGDAGREAAESAPTKSE